LNPGKSSGSKSGGTAEVVENIGDGIWLKARMPDGEEDLVFCEDIAGLAETHAG
jgi:hypothetical protein